MNDPGETSPISEKIILFVCTGNTCRSPIAAELFNHINPLPGWKAESAGMYASAGQPASLLARTVMLMNYELDLSNHRSRIITEDLILQATWVLAMTSVQRDTLHRLFPEFSAKIRTIGEFAGEGQHNIPDPFGHDLQMYQETAATLAELVEKIIQEIKQNN